MLINQVEAGDMVLCKNDLQALLVALDLSTQTMRRIQVLILPCSCLFFSFFLLLYPTSRLFLASSLWVRSLLKNFLGCTIHLSNLSAMFL